MEVGGTVGCEVCIRRIKWHVIVEKREDGYGSSGQVSLGTREEGQTEAKSVRKQTEGKWVFETEGLSSGVDRLTQGPSTTGTKGYTWCEPLFC